MLQASEGGSFSVGERKFKVKESVTPRPVRKPPSSASAEGVPVAMPTNLRTDRISRVSPLRLSTLSPATDKMVVSKSALVGFCLTAFAGGIVMTLAVDRVHARGAEVPRDPEPVVLTTTPIETAPVAAGPTTPVPPAAPVARTLQAPVATSPAAAEAVVVQLPPPAQRQADKPKKTPPPLAPPAVTNERKVAVATPVPAPTPPAVRRVAVTTPVLAPAPLAARKVAAAAPARAVAPRKQPRAVESSPTEAAPEEDPMLPTATKKKWTDPFDP